MLVTVAGMASQMEKQCFSSAFRASGRSASETLMGMISLRAYSYPCVSSAEIGAFCQSPVLRATSHAEWEVRRKGAHDAARGIYLIRDLRV